MIRVIHVIHVIRHFPMDPHDSLVSRARRL